MALKVWNGAVNSDWNTAGNWVGGVPANGDDAVITGSVNIDPIVVATILNSLSVSADYIGTIGTDSSNILDVEGTTFNYFSSGDHCYIFGDWDDITIRSSNKLGAGLVITDSVTHGTGDPTNVYLSEGKVEFLSRPSILLIDYESSLLADAYCVLQDGCSTLYQRAGRCFVNNVRVSVSLNFADGELTIGSLTAVQSFNMYGGVIKNYNTFTSLPTTINVVGGDLYIKPALLSTLTTITVLEDGNIYLLPDSDGMNASEPNLTLWGGTIDQARLNISPKVFDGN